MDLPRGRTMRFVSLADGNPICDWAAITLGGNRACSPNARNGFVFNIRPTDEISYPSPRNIKILRHV